ncbi:MAG: class II fructose-bisphosphate aldolase [Lentisphaeria bacterium]|nr:class II fructose-bisphosphate aldolase [Lentisphaeria bacterium]NQZ68615.1 class II fructose-bisphosphate aldolase [Lentisphaeria bacterium]
MYLSPEQSRQLLEQAAREHFAVLAVNADSPAAIVDCLEAAKAVDAPVIIESSLWQLSSHSFGNGDALLGIERFAAIVELYANSGPYIDVPVLYHTDHIKGPQTVDILSKGICAVNAQGLTASTISLDSSELSADENIALINELCSIAKNNNASLTLEMEAGVDDGLTSLDEARYLLEAVEENNPGYLALWAPGVGTRHGFSAEGFPEFSTEHISRQQALAAEITGRDIGLALHGSSGLSDEQLSDAVDAGVTKVNWSTDSLAARSAAALSYYDMNREKLQRTHTDFKNTAMDNGLQTAVSESYIDRVKNRMLVLKGNGKGQAFCNTHGTNADCLN